jgi:DNA-binding GntR family transcriptional regulator
MSISFAASARDQMVARYTVVDAVYQNLLDAIYNGGLPQGQRISDIRLAEQMGVSRTPVREAIQRLRDIGIIEASPNRFTRVVQITKDEARDALRVWLALYLEAISDVVPHISQDAIEQMSEERRRYHSSVVDHEDAAAAQHFQEFFAILRNESPNALLRKSLNSVSHLVRLGWQSLPPASPDEIGNVLDRMLAALERKDTTEAIEAARDAVRARLRD